MQLFPQDLGTKWHIAVVRHRAVGTARVQLPPHTGKLGRIWARGVPVSSEVASATLPMLADTSTPLIVGFGTFLGLFGATLVGFGHVDPVWTGGTVAVGLYGSAIAIPRLLFARLHSRPVRRDELEALKGAATRKREARAKPEPRVPLMRLFQSLKGTAPRRPGDALEQEFLTLAQDVLEVSGASTTVEKELRGVLRALGDAIASLEPMDYVDGDEALDALADAEALTARARRERDNIVAESLLRQADALVAQAQAGENARRLARRTDALREELLAQTRAVRTLLPTLASDHVAAATGFTRFATLAASVQSVASEVSSVTAAREELNAALYPRSVTATTSGVEPVYQQQGHR